MKKGIIWNYLIGFIIAVVVLIIILFIYAVLRNKGISAFNFFRDFWRFRR